MSVAVQIEPDEDLGRRFYSRGSAKRARRSRVPHREFLPKKDSIKISIDRLSVADKAGADVASIARAEGVSRDGPFCGWASLHFSPHGEAKCVRGPSGLGASRAEEKGASRLARAGVLDKSPPSLLGSRNTAFPVHWPSDISSGANQAPSHGFNESRDTKHESRPFFACFDRRVARNAG